MGERTTHSGSVWLRLFTALVLLASVEVSANIPVIDSKAHVVRAVALIEEGGYSLARSYLEPALIDPRLSAAERARAYYLRGYSFYAQNFYVSARKDYARALEFNPDNPAALAALAGLHAHGLGVVRNHELAYQFFSKAAHGGHVDAQFHVGYAQLEGRGTDVDLDSARGWLKGAADQGHVAAMTYLARSFREVIAEVADPDQARGWYEKAHAAGAVDALVSLAFMYQNGEFGDPDKERARRLFTQAADAGSGAGRVSLGHLYLSGDSGSPDYAKARSLFEQAAAQQIPGSYLGLGHIYEAGLGVEPDLDEAERWYRLGARAELLPAQLRLAGLLLRNEQSDKTPEAMDWLAQAATQNDPTAQNDYAWMLATHPDDALRDGELALTLAQRAITANPSAAFLDTLAAAYAEVGNFTQAVTTQHEALKLLNETQTSLRAELNAHLAAYEEGKRWRQYRISGKRSPPKSPRDPPSKERNKA